MRVYRLSMLMLSALLISAAMFVAVPQRAEAKGLKSFVAKAGTVAAVRAIRKSGKNNDQEDDTAEESATPTPAAQVTAAAEPVPAPVVAVAPPKPVAPPNTGLVCIAGCYDTQGRRAPTL